MIKKVALCMSMCIGICFAMEEKQEEKHVKLIGTRFTEQFAEGLALVREMFDITYAGLPEPEKEEVFEFLETYRPTQLPHLLELHGLGKLNAVLAVIDDRHVGFIASHEDPQTIRRILIDNICPGGEETKKLVINKFFEYLLKRYPDATKAWLAVLKVSDQTPIAEELKAQGFTLSNYLPKQYPAKWFQGWEKVVRK
jgi:hypothetical protein